MLEGAKFPPVVIFQDADGGKYLGDDHHRVDAAALAALKDPRRMRRFTGPEIVFHYEGTCGGMGVC
jgi:hypothetical protein